MIFRFLLVKLSLLFSIALGDHLPIQRGDGMQCGKNRPGNKSLVTIGVTQFLCNLDVATGVARGQCLRTAHQKLITGVRMGRHFLINSQFLSLFLSVTLCLAADIGNDISSIRVPRTWSLCTG